jgi:hypothetical protein
MPLHLVKLCVGVSEPEELAVFQAERRARHGEVFHITRMVPRRMAELRDGGSLYWVIRGQVRLRQLLRDIRPFIDEAGVARCRLVLDSELVMTEVVPRRPFQGWRYLAADDAPRDLAPGAESEAIPAALRAELATLGLI